MLRLGLEQNPDFQSKNKLQDLQLSCSMFKCCLKTKLKIEKNYTYWKYNFFKNNVSKKLIITHKHNYIIYIWLFHKGTRYFMEAFWKLNKNYKFWNIRNNRIFHKRLLWSNSNILNLHHNYYESIICRIEFRTWINKLIISQE